MIDALRRVLALALALDASSLWAACPAVDAQASALLQALVSRHERAQAVQQIVGEGTLQREGERRRLHLEQQVRDGALSQRLTLLGTSGASVLSEAHPLECRHPGHRLLQAAAHAAGDDCGIAGQYRLAQEPGAGVAGRSTVRLLVQPRDPYRYGYVLEVDPEHLVLLKVITVGAGGRVLEQFEYHTLAFEPVPGPEPAGPPLLMPAHSPAQPSRPVANARQLDGRWELSWLPPGFVATDAGSERGDGAAGRGSFTDGFSVFSVFVEQQPPGLSAGEGVVREGSTVSYTRGTRLAGEPVLITVLGEVPVNTARMVADAVQPRR